MAKPAFKSNNTEISNSISKASYKCRSKNVFKRGSAYEFCRGKDATNFKIKEKIREKRAAKTRKKTLQKAVEESQKQKVHKEKTDSIRQLKKTRLERTKIISKKTNRGQPLMKDRIQFLLTKIQEMKRR